MGLETVFKLSLIMNMIDNLTGPMAKVSSGVGGSVSKLQRMEQGFGDMAKGGMAAAAIGGQITEAVLAPVEATFATQRAIGELSSLGVRDLGVVEKAAADFSNTFAGTTKADFISAAYDIKSGIASLSDEGVADMTNMAAITAKATKATAAEMTSLFATGYGIYKDYYNDLSDLEFGEMFGGGIATAVRQFKTTGSGMAQSIQTLGASATTANVPLEEQLSVLGMLQATMGGAEAGTKYKAFLRSAVKGGEELGLSFTDANNQLLSMPQILDILRGRFGETMDAAEKMELQKAFGDTEAVALIDLMYGKVGDLQGNILTMYDALGQGSGAAVEMANAINGTEPDQYQVVQQQIDNMTQSIGNSLLPTIGEITSAAQPVIAKMTDWIDRNQEIVKTIMLVLLVCGGLLTVFGTGAVVIGGFGLATTKAASTIKGFIGIAKKVPSMLQSVQIMAMYAGDGLKAGLGGVKALASGAVGGIKTFVVSMAGMAKQAITTAVTAMPGLIASVWSFTAALWANPITWIVAAILALIAVVFLLWKNWDQVTAFLQGAWDACCKGVAAGIDWLKTGVGNIIDWIGQKIQMFKDCGKKIIETLVGGIVSVATKPVEAIKGIFDKVRKLLPFSDAKEGPLSQLTLSGSRVMTTIAQGIETEAAAPANAVDQGFARINTNLDKPVKKVSLTQKTKDSTADASDDQEAKGKIVRIERLIMQIDFSKIKELPLLLRLLEEIEDLANSSGMEPEEVMA